MIGGIVASVVRRFSFFQKYITTPRIEPYAGLTIRIIRIKDELELFDF